MKDWKKKISPKMSKAHKYKITNNKKKGAREKSMDMKIVFMIELTKVIITYWIKYDKK